MRFSKIRSKPYVEVDSIRATRVLLNMTCQNSHSSQTCTPLSTVASCSYSRQSREDLHFSRCQCWAAPCWIDGNISWNFWGSVRWFSFPFCPYPDTKSAQISRSLHNHFQDWSLLKLEVYVSRKSPKCSHIRLVLPPSGNHFWSNQVSHIAILAGQLHRCIPVSMFCCLNKISNSPLNQLQCTVNPDK